MRTGETLIARDMLKPGDHIYRHGKGSSYTHHGIYVGEEMVIHFTRTKAGGKEVISRISSSSSHHESDSNPCPKCNYKSDLHRGVVKTCLDCFLSVQKHIYLHEYGISDLQMLFGPSPGGTTVHSRLPSQVVNFASHVLETNGFGNYSLMFNNCEDFAYYCKTGVRGSRQFHFVVFYMTTLGFLLAIESLVFFRVKFVSEMFVLSLLKFDIEVVLLALFFLINLLKTLRPFFEFLSFVIYAMTLFDSGIRTFLVLLFAIIVELFEFLIYITSRLIYIIISWLEFNSFSLTISHIFVLLKLLATLEFFSLIICSIILFKSDILAILSITLFETNTMVSLSTSLQCTLCLFSLKFLGRVLFFNSIQVPIVSYPVLTWTLWLFSRIVIHLGFLFILETHLRILFFVLCVLFLIR